MIIDDTWPNPKYDPQYSGVGTLTPIDAIKLALLFHSSSPWDDAKRAEWLRITGSSEASTKVLCDHLRAVLSENKQ